MKQSKHSKNKSKQNDQLVLIVDTEDNYRDDNDNFYVHPERINQLVHLKDKIFDEALIKNCTVEQISGFKLGIILKKMKFDSVFTVIINQPLSVLLPYDAKQIEANSKLAGFDRIEVSEYMYIDEKKNKEVSTLTVSGIRPERNSK